MEPFLVGDAARGESAASAAQPWHDRRSIQSGNPSHAQVDREALWAEISGTAVDRSEVEDEIRYLMAV